MSMAVQQQILEGIWMLIISGMAQQSKAKKITMLETEEPFSAVSCKSRHMEGTSGHACQ